MHTTRLAGGRCSPRKEEVPDGDIVMGRVYPTSDPAESLFDYRVASDANKKLALGAKQWSMRRRPFFLASSTPSTHRTTHVAQLRTQKLQRRESKSGTWQVKTDLQGTTQLMLNMKLVFDDRLAGFRNPACRL